MLTKWMLHVKPEIPNKIILTFTKETGMQTEPETYINMFKKILINQEL